MPTQTIDMNDVTSVSFNNQNVEEIILNNEKIWPQVQDNYVSIFGLYNHPFSLTTANGTKNWDGTLQYSTDLINWSVWDGTSINSSNDGALYLKGRNNTYITGASSPNTKYWVFSTEDDESPLIINMTGNFESLLDYIVCGTGRHPVMATACFSYLFYNDSYINMAADLPARYDLPTLCYASMFENCTRLYTAARLAPISTTFASGSSSQMKNMYKGCTNLRSLIGYSDGHGNLYPVLNATSLVSYCYSGMFYGCTNLDIGNNAGYFVLPATTLDIGCYQDMFNGCTSLTSTPALPATTLAAYCYQNMFKGCTSIEYGPNIQASTAHNCQSAFSSMFSGCNKLISGPTQLPSMSGYCVSMCSNMFSGCTSLTTAPSLPSTTLFKQCYSNMFFGCTALTTPPSLPATTLAEQCYSQMFMNCTSLTTAPSLPATKLSGPRTCYQMFRGCTNLETLPALKSITLTDRCYSGMFYGCTKIKLATTQDSTYINEYRIPISGTGTNAASMTSMFTNTGGTFTGAPGINTTYYTSNTIVS